MQKHLLHTEGIIPPQNVIYALAKFFFCVPNVPFMPWIQTEGSITLFDLMGNFMAGGSISKAPESKYLLVSGILQSILPDLPNPHTYSITAQKNKHFTYNSLFYALLFCTIIDQTLKIIPNAPEQFECSAHRVGCSAVVLALHCIASAQVLLLLYLLQFSSSPLSFCKCLKFNQTEPFCRLQG